MTPRSADADVFVRFLAGEPRDQHARAARLFEAVAAGMEQIYLEEVVAAEVLYVLVRQYQRQPSAVATWLSGLISGQGVLATDKKALLSALGLYGRGDLDFVDALVATKALRRGVPEVWSFDRDFDQIAGVKRLEP